MYLLCDNRFITSHEVSEKLPHHICFGALKIIVIDAKK
jgi:hypothetical protein